MYAVMKNAEEEVTFSSGDPNFSPFTFHDSRPFEMKDVHDKKTRSINMSRIRGRDTKPEILVRKFLFAKGFRYKLHDKTLPGRPDLIFSKYKAVIFIHGCF